MINKIYNTDCMDILSSIDNDSVDLIAIDPPYEIFFEKNEWDKKVLNWYILCNEYFRILKPTGNLIVFQGWTNVSETKSILEKNFKLKNWIVWDRIKGRGAKTNVVSTREDILWFSKTENYTYNKIYSNIKKKTAGLGNKNGQPNRALSNVWTDISPIVPWSAERVSHPTQKPLQIMERIITIWSNENDLILDTFMGSGTTGVACKKLNRNFIGIEMNEEYFNIAKDRIEKTEIFLDTENQNKTQELKNTFF
jgi:site-specific DNA-methyltransferase (adenine-specific)